MFRTIYSTKKIFQHRINCVTRTFNFDLLKITGLFIVLMAINVDFVLAQSPSDLVVEGGFELPDLETGRRAYRYRPTGSAWAFTGNAGLAGNGSNFTRITANAPEGDQVLFLQGANAQATQDFTAAAAGSYKLTVQMVQRIQSGQPNAQVVSVLIDDIEVGQIKPTGDYMEHIVPFNLDAGAHKLTFKSLTSGANTAFVDAAELVAVPLERWSDSATWNSGSLLLMRGGEVIIPDGKTVLLDQDVNMKSITVMGALICDDKDMTVTTENIMIMDNGYFLCGSQNNRFENKLTITLVGAKPANTQDEDGMHNMGHKLIGVMGRGILEIHGEERVSWTQLNGSLNKGRKWLRTVDPVDWRPGDQIVLAAGRDIVTENEVATVTKVAWGGHRVEFQSGTIYPHYGKINSYTNTVKTWNLDERAEVGLLTRNIKIQGDAQSEDDGFGGHIMTMLGTTAHVSGVELYRVGQKSVLARYPFHWHVVDDATGQSFKNSSVHRSYNRCVTVHGTNNTTVADNVCYDFVGHGYFLEDGYEQGNTFDHNLAIGGKKPRPIYYFDTESEKEVSKAMYDKAQKEDEENDKIIKVDEAILPTDRENKVAGKGPASFWITNPSNTFTNNAAAGTEGSGFWYRVEDRIDEKSESYEYLDGAKSMNPQKLPFGVFANNRAHSAAQGFSSCTQGQSTEGMESNNIVIENMTTYHNEQNLWPCGDGVHHFINAMSASSENGLQAPTPMIFEDSIFIAYTNNMPLERHPENAESWVGVTVYDQGLSFDQVHFVNYDSPNMGAFGNGAGSFQRTSNRVKNLTFTDSPYRWARLNPFFHHGFATDLVHDLDGSYTDQSDIEKEDWAVVMPAPYLYDHKCYKNGDTYVFGYICPYHYALFRSQASSNSGEFTIARSDGEFMTRTDYTGFNGGQADNGLVRGAVPITDDYHMIYRYEEGMKHEQVTLSVHDASSDDHDASSDDQVIYELLDVPEDFSILNEGWTRLELPANTNQKMTRLLDDLRDATEPTYFWEDHSLFVKLFPTGADWNAEQSVTFCLTSAGTPGTMHQDAEVDLGSLPEVNITEPLHGAHFAEGEMITVKADLRDSDNIKEMRVYLGTEYIGKDRTPPYRLWIHNPPVGKHALKLVVEDRTGQTYTEIQSVTIGGTNPDINIVSHGELETVSADSDVEIQFEVHNFNPTNSENGDHIRLTHNNESEIVTSTSSITPELVQGVNGILLELVQADGKILSASDRAILYGVQNNVLANFGGNIDPRQHLSGPGTHTAQISLHENSHNKFTIKDDGDGVTETIRWRLELEPSQDWLQFNNLKVRSSYGNGTYELFIEDAEQGLIKIGDYVLGQQLYSLNVNASYLDEVTAIEFHFQERVTQNFFIAEISLE